MKESRALKLAAGGDGLSPVDGAESPRTLAALAQLIHNTGRPLIVCFDQLHNLQPDQIAALSRLIHEVIDRGRNVLVILSEVREQLIKLHQSGSISQATWDRVKAHQVDMGRLSVPEGGRLLQARLEAFLRPFEDVPEVNRHLKADALFPLGEG